MSAHSSQGQWLPILTYAFKSGLSVSTIRRYIKANKVEYIKENGRYYLWFEESPPTTSSQQEVTSSSSTEQEQKIAKLESDLQKAQEEIAELKTLLALYEEKFYSSKDL